MKNVSFAKASETIALGPEVSPEACARKTFRTPECGPRFYWITGNNNCDCEGVEKDAGMQAYGISNVYRIRKGGCLRILEYNILIRVVSFKLRQSFIIHQKSLSYQQHQRTFAWIWLQDCRIANPDFHAKNIQIRMLAYV